MGSAVGCGVGSGDGCGVGSGDGCGGGTPVWAGEISPYLRFMGSEEIGALFPGVPLPVRRS